MSRDTTDDVRREDDQEAAARRRAQAIGERLRRIRHQQGLSLADVQERSGGRWKAVVVGAYERGDRSASITRLEELARFYGVPIADLFPTTDPGPPPGDEPDPARVVLDLLRLAGTDAPEVRAVARFARGVLQRRGDHNGRVLTLRLGDIDAVALAIGSDPHQLRSTLASAGILRPTSGATAGAGPITRARARPAAPPRSTQARTASRHGSRSTNPAAS